MSTTTAFSEAANLKARLRAVLEDPVDFSSTFFGSSLWGVQEEILRAVASHPRVAVKACHASGKTFAAALAVLYWIASRPNGIAITTAPTWPQVEKILWGEIHRALVNGRLDFGVPNATEIRLGPENYAIGLSTNEGVRFQGYHGDVLVVMDEAPGVRPEIWEAVEGIRAGGDVRVLALGNPTITGGPFHRAFHESRETWRTFTVSAFDTPNLAGLDAERLRALSPEDLGRDERPYLVRRAWVREKLEEWGEDHPLYQSRVLGQFPKEDEAGIIPLSWIEEANRVPVAPLPKEAKVRAGLDIAGPGEDETVLSIAHGGAVVVMRAWNVPDPRGDVLAALVPWAREGRLESFQYDEVGIGYGIGLYLAERLRPYGVRCAGINAGSAARDPERFANLKAEAFWALRERAKDRTLAVPFEKAVAQLTAIRYKHDARGRVVVESKEELRKRGVKSPDHAESVMLAFAVPGNYQPEPDIF